MAYHFQYILQELKNNLNIFQQLLKETEEMALWKSSPEKWCLLEIVRHLYDEEREDFRARIEEILLHPGQTLSSIDPQTWVRSRKYLHQNYRESLSSFFSERENSLIWLREKIHTLIPASWDCLGKHPQIGEISAYGLIENWLGHDYLHIQQIIRLKIDYLSQLNGNSLDYARG